MRCARPMRPPCPRHLKVIGTSPAGHPFAGKIGAGETVRIFTGGVVPDGADAIVIQEDTRSARRHASRSRKRRPPERHIRKAGLDFRNGDVLATAGKRLTARDLSLIAAGDVPELSVRRRPRIALAATGDELTLPGAPEDTGRHRGIVRLRTIGR